jgi:diguanylate cyclase (GGDEF)-like protein
MNEELDDLVKLSYFADIGKAIASARTIDQVMTRVMERIGEIFGPQNWSLLLLDRKSKELYFKLVIGIDAEKLRGIRIPVGEGIAGWIAQTGQSAIVQDVARDARFTDRIDQLISFTTHSVIGVPLKTDRGLLGVIELLNRNDGRPFTALELKLLTTIADFAAIAIEKAYYSRALKRVATIDPLTGAHNRRSFQRLFAREVARCKRSKGTLSLLMIDIDRFKEVNDRFGHVAGDKVLQALANLLEDTVRTTDTVVRYGGDEFVVLMPDTRKADAEIARRRISEAIDVRNASGVELPFNVSVGLHSATAEHLDELVFRSDADLYQQKVRKDEKPFEQIEVLFQDMIDYEEREPDKEPDRGVD